MNARKHYDRFSCAPVRNDRGGPTIALMVDRQPEILKALADHNQLTANDIFALVGGNRRSLYDTLRILKAEPNEFIRIVPEQIRAKNLRAALCYQLAPKGVRWLKDHGHNAAPPKRSFSLSHDALASHAIASIKAGSGLQPGAHFISADEIRRHPTFPSSGKDDAGLWTIPHPRKRRMHPDSDLFGVRLAGEGQRYYRFYLLEADNGTSGKGETIWPESPEQYDGSSIFEKLEAYVPFIEGSGFKEKWGIPNLYVLFLFRDAARLKRTAEKFATLGGSRFVLLQLADPNGPRGYLFLRAWERVGFEPLFLNQP